MTAPKVVYVARGHRWLARPGQLRPLHSATCTCWRLPSVHDYDPSSPDGVPLPPVRETYDRPGARRWWRR